MLENELAEPENILPELKTVLPNADFVIEGYVDPTGAVARRKPVRPPRRPVRSTNLFGHRASNFGFRTADFRQNALAREKSRPCEWFGFSCHGNGNLVSPADE